MPSEIDELLSASEKRILAFYKNPNANDMSRLYRLSAQYMIAGGFICWLAISYQQPLYSLGLYGLFVIYLAIRIKGANALVGVMPGIIAKYEAEIRRLKQQDPNDATRT